jgi:hypothetical protein
VVVATATTGFATASMSTGMSPEHSASIAKSFLPRGGGRDLRSAHRYQRDQCGVVERGDQQLCGVGDAKHHCRDHIQHTTSKDLPKTMEGGRKGPNKSLVPRFPLLFLVPLPKP